MKFIILAFVASVLLVGIDSAGVYRPYGPTTPRPRATTTSSQICRDYVWAAKNTPERDHYYWYCIDGNATSVVFTKADVGGSWERLLGCSHCPSPGKIVQVNEDNTCKNRKPATESEKAFCTLAFNLRQCIPGLTTNLFFCTMSGDPMKFTFPTTNEIVLMLYQTTGLLQ